MLKKLGKLNSYAAGMIDRNYRDYPKNILGRFLVFVKIRVIYSLLFLPLSVLDLITNSLLSLRYLLGVMLRADDIQQDRLKHLQEHGTLFSKNFYALLSCIFGLISPKLVAFYFTPDADEGSTVKAGGNYHQDPHAIIKKISSVTELQDVIKQAAREGKTVIPRGAGRSQGKQFLEADWVLDLTALKQIEIDTEAKIATVGGGVIWSKLQKKADKKQLALKVMQASNVFSVGGSIGTNIHGWDHQSGMLSNTILAMTIVNAQGEVEELTPENPLFHQVCGGLGLFGIVVEVKLQLTDNILLTETGQEIAPSAYPAYFRRQVLSDPSHKMHLYRLSLDPKHLLQSGVAVSYVETASQPQSSPHFITESPSGTRFNRVMINLARRLGFVRKMYWDMERKRLLANQSEPMTVNEIMQPPINAMFNPAVSESEWLQEYFLPETSLAPFLTALGQLLTANQVVLLNASVRFVKQNERSPLSYAQNGDRYAVVLCFNQSLQDTALIKAQKWLRKAQSLVTRYGGSYYLPYQHISSPEDFAASYPRANEALAIKSELDPTAIFNSGFYQKYLMPARQTNHFKIMMSTPENRAQFRGFLTHVLHRLDADRFFHLLQDIMEYKDTHAEIYAELQRRLIEISPNTIKDLNRILTSLSRIKADLGQQAQLLLPSPLKKINGLVEIGYPGRFIGGLQQRFEVEGEMVAVFEGPSLSDYIQTGFPRPYQRFAKLDYQQPRLTTLPDASADLITCYVGLHHFELRMMEQFLEDIKRVLRPNGHFLLVDHDVTDETSLTMAHMAHSIFNVVTGVKLDEEIHEIRNFLPITEWQTVLSRHGLFMESSAEDAQTIRAGDPSRNRMISLVKSE